MQPDISKAGLDLSKWTEVRRNDPRPIGGKIIKGFYSLSHTHNSLPNLVMARFFLDHKELHRAWGWKQEKHCSYHVLFVKDDIELRKGCPPVRVVCGETDVLQYTFDKNMVSIPVTII